MVSLKEIEEVMSIYIKHQTHPLAIKLLRREDGDTRGCEEPGERLMGCPSAFVRPSR